MRIALSFLLALSLACPALADGPPGKDWKQLKKVKIGPFDAKTSLQGTLDGFERVIGPSLTFTAYGEKITLRVKGKKVSVIIGGATKAKPIPKMPAVIFLGPKKDKQRKAILIAQHGLSWVWTPHWGASFTLGKRRTFLMVDADGDGKLWELEGEKPADAIVGPHSRTAAPWTGVCWSETGGWHVQAKGDAVYSKPASVPAGKDQMAGFALLNAWRQAAGCAAVKWSAATAKGCKEHAEYCRKNNIRTHDQDESNPHYTEAGSDAASSGVLSFAYSSNREGILEQLGTSFHLSSVLSPGSRAAGMAVVGSNFVCNVDGDGSGEQPQGPIAWVWPPNGSTDIARAFNQTGEMPMPVPGQENNHKWKIGQVVMAKVDGHGPWKLTVVTDRGEKIEGTLTTPKKPVKHPAVRDDNMGLMIFAPKQPLPANTGFTATVSFTLDELAVVRTWTFRTGAKAHLVICHGGGGGRRRR